MLLFGWLPPIKAKPSNRRILPPPSHFKTPPKYVTIARAVDFWSTRWSYRNQPRPPVSCNCFPNQFTVCFTDPTSTGLGWTQFCPKLSTITHPPPPPTFTAPAHDSVVHFDRVPSGIVAPQRSLRPHVFAAGPRGCRGQGLSWDHGQPTTGGE